MSREYLLVEQDRRHADLFRREDDAGGKARWVLYASGAADDVVLESVGVRFSMDTLFEDVAFETVSAGPASTA